MAKTRETDDKLVGAIVEAPSAMPSVSPAFRVPAPEELAGFPPPPPLNASAVPPTPPGMVFGDRSTHSGLTVGTLMPQPVIDVTGPEIPPITPQFDALPKKTKMELMATHVARYGTTRGFIYDEPVEPPKPLPVPVVEPEPMPNLSKLSKKTRAEMERGRERLARRDADYRDVIQRVARNNAELAEKGEVSTDSMGYSSS